MDMDKVERIAAVSHEANRAYCRTIGDDSQPPWEEAPEWQRDSARHGVMFVLGNPDSTAEDQHQCWLDLKVREGWTFGEKKDPEKKTHPCLLPYAELPPEQQAKDRLFGAVVGALR